MAGKDLQVMWATHGEKRPRSTARGARQAHLTGEEGCDPTPGSASTRTTVPVRSSERTKARELGPGREELNFFPGEERPTGSPRKTCHLAPGSQEIPSSKSRARIHSEAFWRAAFPSLLKPVIVYSSTRQGRVLCSFHLVFIAYTPRTTVKYKISTGTFAIIFKAVLEKQGSTHNESGPSRWQILRYL